MKNAFILSTILILFGFQNLQSQSDVKINNQAHLENKIHFKKEIEDSIPVLFTIDASYDNKTIKILIGNPLSKKSVILQGLARVSETAKPEEFKRQVSLSGELEELIELKVEGIYDIYLEFKDAVDTDLILDEIYISDGAWSIYNYQASAILHKFEISQDVDRYPSEDSYIIERNVSLKGRIKNDFSISKSLTLEGNGFDFSSFTAFEFSARGEGKLQVVLVNEDIEDWEDQHKTSITLSDKTKGFQLKKEDLGGNLVDWTAINKIVFLIKGSGHFYTNLDLEISELRFIKEQRFSLSSNKVQSTNILPNPITNLAKLTFESNLEMTYEFQIWSVGGKLIQSNNGSVQKGINEVLFSREGVEAGTYFSRLITSDGEVRLSRLVFL